MKRLRRIGERIVIAAGIFLLPVIAHAKQCDGTGASSVTNPLQFCNIMGFVKAALQLFVILALPVLAFFIVLAGFNFILARGNSSKLERAKMNFLYVIIGTCLVLGAWLLASLIGATISQITG